MVDSTGREQGAELKDSWLDTLEALKSLGGQAVGQEKIAEARGVTKQAVDKLFPEVEEAGLIAVERGGKPFLYKLTGRGYQVVDSPPYGVGEVDREEGKVVSLGSTRLHGLSAAAKVAEGGVLPEKWMGVLKGKERVEFVRRQGENNSFVITNRFFLRLHKESVTVQLREGVSYPGENDVEVFLNFHEELRELLEWLNRVSSGVRVRLDHVDLRRCELAFEDHHLAVLVSEIDELSLDDFSVDDPDLGKEVISLDDSFGPEFETKSGERAEEVGRAVDGELKQFLRPEVIKARHSWERELSLQDVDPVSAVRSVRRVPELDGVVQDVKERVERHEESVESIQEYISELQETREREKSTRDALMEQVRATNNLAREIKEEVGGENRGEVYENPVQEKFMEYWRDPDFNRPFFHKDSGGLMVFWRDGSGCRKIFTGEEVERLT